MSIRAVLVQAEGWEGLYVDGALADEGHSLGEGNVPAYWMYAMDEYDFTSKEFKSVWLDDQDAANLYESGNLPPDIDELEGKYV